MQHLEKLAFYQYDNFRPGIWLATGKRRLGKYGDFNYRIDIPPRDFERMLNEGTASVRPSYGEDAVINIFEPIPTGRITRAKTGDRSLSDTRAPVDELNFSMFKRLANRWNLNVGTLHTINRHKPVGMPLSEYLHQIVNLKPSKKRALFPDDPYLVTKLILDYPTGALRTAFDKMETPMGISMLKDASGDLLDDLKNLGGRPADDLRRALAGIAGGIKNPYRFIKEHPYVNRYYLKPLEIDVHTLYEP